MNDLKRNRKGEKVLKTIERLYEIHGVSLLVYKFGSPDPLIDLPEEDHLED